MKVLLRNQQRLIKINLNRIKKDSLRLLKSFNLKKAELGILLVNDRRMKKLNHLHRGINKTTDVLSFPQLNSDKLLATSDKLKNKTSLLVTRYPLLPLGDIVINLHAAKRQSSKYSLTLYGEVRQLLIHGFLHLLGYDHERSRYHEKKMERQERELKDTLETLD